MSADTIARGIIAVAEFWLGFVYCYFYVSTRKEKLTAKELDRVNNQLTIVRCELAEIKARRHNAAVKGAKTKKEEAMRIQLPKAEGVAT